MSSNKLPSVPPSPSLSLGPGVSFSLTTSHLSNLTPPPTQPLGASPLATPPTQPLGASQLAAAQTLSLSANTLNALNALNNPAQTFNTLGGAPNQALGPTLNTLNASSHNLNTLNNSSQTLNSLNNSGQPLNPLNNSVQTLGTLTNAPQTLNTLSTNNQALAALTPPGGALSTLNAAGPSAGGCPSSQAFLASQPMSGIVSLPQTFCFPSQPVQTSGSPANQTAAALGMTLGFPLAALSSNTVSLNTSTLPLTSIPGLSSGTVALNTGQPLSQQLLSLGQQPAALCASLPQNLQFPLGQALLGMSNAATAGASGGPFISTSLGPFPGLPSVIMGGQGMLMGGSSPAGPNPTTAPTLQTLGAALNPQSLPLPLPTPGPIITELPATSQSAEAAQQSVPCSNGDGGGGTENSGGPSVVCNSSPQMVTSQASQVTSSSEDKNNGSQVVPSQQGTEAQPIVVLDSGVDSHTPIPQQNPSKPPGLSDSQENCQTVNVEEAEKSTKVMPPASEQQKEQPKSSKEQNYKTSSQEKDKPTAGPENAGKSSSQTADKESSPSLAELQQPKVSHKKSPLSWTLEKPRSEVKDTGGKNADSGCEVVVEERQEEDMDTSDVCVMDNNVEPRASSADDVQPVEDSSGRMSVVCLEDIKQEVVEMEDSVSPPPRSSDSPTQVLVRSACSPPASSSSPVKLEPGRASRSSPSDLYTGMGDVPTSSMQLSVGLDLLPTVKQESLEEEEEMGVGLGMLGLPDSTPGGSEDSQDSYYYYGARNHRNYARRLSPSPMATLQLTRADTTTTFTTLASASSTTYNNAKPLCFDDEGKGDVKVMLPAESTLMEMEEPEFVWEDYLQETGAISVPPTAFRHVECSLQSCLTRGMRVEVANKSQPGMYWVASVVMVAGPLLRLRYEGYEDDGAEDFWCDLNTCEIHPIGWCAQNSVALLPPDGLKDKFSDWPAQLQEILKTVPIAPKYLLDKATGTVPSEQLKQGMRLELQAEDRPVQVWLVRIKENVGGRLYLSPEGLDGGSHDFWAFYLHQRLHPIGWASQRGYRYVPPKALIQQGLSESEIQQILESALKEAEEQNFPVDIFKDQEPIREHRFKKGMKLEAVNPTSTNHIGPATVVEVLDPFYFIVEMDSLEVEGERGDGAPHEEEGDGRSGVVGRTRFCCHSSTPTIFPIQWTAFKGIKLTAPHGWPKPDFSWPEYLNYCRALAAPETCFLLEQEEHQFERGMKLEAVNPENPNQICAATITQITAHLMWVHLDSSSRMVGSHVQHVGSQDLFPVGWCESNGYQLRPPHRSRFSGGAMRRRVAVVQPEMAESNQESEGNMHCPKIYFNHKCFSGPHLNKGRIALLPRSVGPGSMMLVMKEVLGSLINVAYKSSRVLREIQLDGPPNPAMNKEVFKAKYKGKTYRAVVEVCRYSSQLEDFLRQTCIKLECCPFLLSPHNVSAGCPERCFRLTKTKYTYYYGKKKRKIGRPPGGHTNLENGPKKPMKRRKRRRLGMVVRKSHPNNEEEDKVGQEEEEEMEEEEEEGDDKASETSDSLTADSSCGAPVSSLMGHRRPHSTTSAAAAAAASKRLKRKYTHHIPPPSEIRTRGAKLPRYSFERRTHKKILLSPVQSSGASALRSKSVQNLQMSSSAKFRPSPSPEFSVMSLSGQTHLSFNGGSTGPYHPMPRSSLPPSSLSLGGGGSSMSLGSGGVGGSFSLPAPYTPVPLKKNPLHWTVAETVDFIKTTDCAHVAKMFREQLIDGQAFLLLSLPAVQDHLDLKLGPAIKLCHEIQRVKEAYFLQFHHPDTTIHSPF